MASSFSQIKAGLDEIAASLQSERTQITGAKTTLTNAGIRLDTMATNKGALIADIDAALAATPTDPAIINAKAEKDRLVAEYNTLKTVATAGVNAITL